MAITPLGIQNVVGMSQGWADGGWFAVVTFSSPGAFNFIGSSVSPSSSRGHTTPSAGT